MAAQAANLMSFSLDQSGGALVDLSAYIKSSSVDLNRDSQDVTTYGATWKAFLALLMSGSISLEGEHQSAAATVLRAAFASGVTLTFQADELGVGSGKPRITGECWVTAYKRSYPVAANQTFSATLQITGPVTETAQA